MTAGDIPIGDFTYPVTSNMSAAQAGQFSAVYLNNTTLALATSGIQKMLGILQDNPDGSTKATVGAVRELGHSKCWVTADDTINAGDGLIISSTAGMLRKSQGSDVVVAIAVEGNGGVSCIIEVALTNRIAEGAVYRAGQFSVTVPMVNFGTAGGSVTAIQVPLGWTGTITGMYAVPVKVASTSGATTLSLVVNSTAVTGLTCVCSNAALKLLGTPITETGTVTGGGAFSTPATDTISIASLSTLTFAGDTGLLEVHIMYN
jgi:hypothetical protein